MVGETRAHGAGPPERMALKRKEAELRLFQVDDRHRDTTPGGGDDFRELGPEERACERRLFFLHLSPRRLLLVGQTIARNEPYPDRGSTLHRADRLRGRRELGGRNDFSSTPRPQTPA